MDINQWSLKSLNTSSGRHIENEYEILNTQQICIIIITKNNDSLIVHYTSKHLLTHIYDFLRLGGFYRA